jgi:predicted amidohydrolase YtcJ
MVQDAINLAYKNHWQILAHANGDAAIDQYLATIETANAQYGQADRRNVIIHAQTMREDQLDQAKKLGLFLRSSHYILTTGAIGINMKRSAQKPTEFPLQVLH